MKNDSIFSTFLTMKRVFTYIISVISILTFSACAVIISDESYSMAVHGQTMTKYENFNCSQETLRNATLLALEERGWIITDKNNPIKARLTKLRQDARLAIDVRPNSLWIETKGSLVDGNKAYVPISYLNNLLLSIRKNVQILSK